MRRFAAGFAAIRNGDDFDLRALARQNVPDVAGTHVACADDTKTNLAHFTLSPLSRRISLKAPHAASNAASLLSYWKAGISVF